VASVLDKMQDILKSGDMCVLATCAEGKPHCSLMAYMTDDAAKMVFMVTLKETQKYRNLMQNPLASLLVDTRKVHPPSARQEIQALTVSGTFQPIAETTEKKRILEKMAERHPHLKELLTREDAEPFVIKIESFLLLDGVLDAYFIET
jgi:nitroimidazol reductase NimA-like FMN-containing flavoprotein (pyridoxamine 5'-phosphate oxidase superfamily)